MAKNKEKKAKATELSNYYRAKVFCDGTLELLPKEDFSNLIDVAKYAHMGVWAAIEAAFCMGY